jgi:hypothetical protein
LDRNTTGRSASLYIMLMHSAAIIPAAAGSVSPAPREPASNLALPITPTFNLGSERPALTSLLSLSTISAGVFLGTPTPYHWLIS